MPKIEKHHPLPRIDRYPFFRMEVGDSFTIAPSERASAAPRASYCTKKTGRKFVSRTVMNVIRFWRVS